VRSVRHEGLALLRRLGRRPGFALAVLTTLALGVGANTVTFDLLYGYLLAPLPYPHSEQLANLYFTSPATLGNLGMSYTTYFDLRKQTTAVADTGILKEEDLNLVSGQRAAHVRGAEVTASLLTTIGVPPLLGRPFGPEANQPGAAPQVLLSHRLWSQLFDRDPAAVGKSVQLNGVAYTVAGVMPERFQLPDPDTDLWLAKIFDPSEYEADNVTAFGNTMIVRLKPGVSPSQLAAQAQTVLDREIAHFPDPAGIPILSGLKFRMVATPLRGMLVGDLGEHLLLAQLATGLLLLLIWVNLANLFIARALRQRGELVLRRVLGAQTHVLFRELLTESLTLCLAGGAAGFLLGQLTVRVLLQADFVSAALPPADDVVLVAGLALLLAVLSALVFALAGLYFIRRQDLAQALKDMDAHSAGGRGERRVRAALVITQLTIACVLSAIGLTLVHGLMKLGTLELGFAPQSLVTFQLHLPTSGDHPGPALHRQLAQVHQALRRIPGVTAATLASNLPFDGQSEGNGVYPHPFDGKHTPTVAAIITDSDYFRTLGVPLRFGSMPATAIPGAEGEAVVDVQAAQAVFGTTDAVGRELVFNKPDETRPNMIFRVRGVVGGTRRSYAEAGSGMGSVYLNREQVLQTTGPGWSWASETWYVVVQTPLATAAILPALKQAVEAALPGVPLYDVRTMEGRLSQELAPRRSLAALVMMFALSALAVAAVGLYAVASYTVGQRRPELGIRAALGGSPARLRHLVLREVGQQLLVGAPIGIVGAVILGRVFSDSLYGLPGTDLISLVLVALVLAAVTLIAGWVPAWRASRVSPVEALRAR